MHALALVKLHAHLLQVQALHKRPAAFTGQA